MSGTVLRDIFNRQQAKKPISKEQKKRANAKLAKMSKEDQEAYKALEKATKSQREKNYLQKALASGYPLWQLEAFADEIRGQSEEWLDSHLKVNGSKVALKQNRVVEVNGAVVPDSVLQGGMIQQYVMSCPATTVQTVKAALDPIYALKLHKDAEARIGRDIEELTLQDTAAGAEQRELLEKDLQDQGGWWGGKAIRILAAEGEGRGRMGITDILNDESIREATGLSYTFNHVKSDTIDSAVTDITSDLRKGRPVPLGVGGTTEGDYLGAHLVLAVGLDEGPPVTILIHDPATGETVARTEEQIRNNKLALPSGWDKLCAYDKAGLATKVTHTAATVARGQNVIVNVTATTESGPATGNILLQIAGTAYSQPLASGAAAFDAGALPVGTHKLRIEFPAQNDCGGSITTGTVQVTQAATTLTLASSSTTPAQGTAITFTATIAVTTPGVGPATGAVQFKVLGANFGAPVALAAGRAVSAPIASLAAGGSAIRAEFAGDADYGASAADLTQTITAGSGTPVVQAATTMTLSPSNSSPSYGEVLTLTATVAVTSPGTGPATGAVQFLIDGKPEGAPVLLTGSGSAVCTPATSLKAETRKIVAIYAGNANFAHSQASLDLVVKKANTTTAIVSSQNTSAPGEPVTFSATVTRTGGGTGDPPSGLVCFLIPDQWKCIMKLVAGRAVSPAHAALPSGTNTVTAFYSGDDNFNASNGPITQTVTGTANPQQAVKMAVNPSSNPVVAGAAVHFSGTIVAADPSKGEPSGTVQFQIDGNNFGAAAAISAGKVVSAPIASLSPGPHEVAAWYSGDGVFKLNVRVTNVNVVLPPGATTPAQQGTTTLTLASATNPSPSGQSSELTATAAVAPPGVGPATGHVQFQMDGKPHGPPVELSTGVARYSPTLPVGRHLITAVYGGAPAFGPSTSNTINQVVNGAATALTLTSSSPTAVQGTAVTFTARLTAAGIDAGKIVGTVQFKLAGSAFGAPVPVSGGQAVSAAVAGLPAGTTAVRAEFDGGTEFAASAADIVQTVTGGSGSPVVPVATTTRIVPSTATPRYGDVVTLTATVSLASSSTITLTGNVQFLIDGKPEGAAMPLLPNGTAVCTPAAVLLGGTRRITAVYAGAAGLAPSTSTVVNVVVATAASVVALTSSGDNSSYGEVVRFTARVTGPGAVRPTGTVAFSTNGFALCAPMALVNGTAVTPALAYLVAMANPIVANYSGDGNFAPGNANLTQTVVKSPSTTVVTSSKLNSNPGEPVVFSATVTGSGAGTPSGWVQFKIGGAVFGSAVKLSAGRASSPPHAGLAPSSTNTITAEYLGDDNFAASTSAAITQTVAAATSGSGAQQPTALRVILSNPTPRFGEPFVMEAKVTQTGGGTGAVTGEVLFLAAGKPVAAPVALASGKAQFQLRSALPVGTHYMGAVYSGGADFKSCEQSGPLNVLKGDTTTEVISTPNPAVVGNNALFIATVRLTAPAAGAPTGRVLFKVGGVNHGSPVAVKGGQAQIAWTAPPIPGFNRQGFNITAHYAGDGNCNPSDSAVQEQVVRAARAGGDTLTNLTTSKAATVFGEPVTFNATVIPDGVSPTIPTGKVQFFDNSKPLSPEIVLNGTGAAQFTMLSTNPLPVGTRTISVKYIPDTGFIASSNVITQTVNEATAQTTLTPSATAGGFGVPVNFTAVLAAVTPATGTPAGAVQFRVDGKDLFTPVVLAAGSGRSPALTTLPPGEHKVVAYYLGDGSFSPCLSAVVNYTVAKATTAVIFTSPPASSTVGDAVSFPVEVRNSGGGPTPIGAVLFTVDGTPGAPSDLVEGRAALTISTPLAVGPHTFKVQFTGSANFAASPEVQVTHTVNPVATTTTFLSPPASSTAGDAVSFNVEVKSATGTAKPTGNVQFTVAGSGTIAPVALADGKATLSLPLPLAVGAHAIKAVYTGEGNFAASPEAQTTHTVTAAATVTNLAASATEAVAGTSVTFTAKVATDAKNAGTVGGNVVFRVDGKDVATVPLKGDSATCTEVLATGAHTVVAAFAGGDNFLGSTSAEAKVKINAAATDTAVSASSAASVAGAPVTFTATITANAANAGPLGGAVSFLLNRKAVGSPVPLSTAGVATYTPDPPLPVGTHTVGAEYSGGGNFLGSYSEVGHEVKPAPTEKKG